MKYSNKVVRPTRPTMQKLADEPVLFNEIKDTITSMCPEQVKVYEDFGGRLIRDQSAFADLFSQFSELDFGRCVLGGELVAVCSAKKLHKALEVSREFSKWIKERVDTYKLTEGEDFTFDSPILSNQSVISVTPNEDSKLDSPKLANQVGWGGDRRGRDYHLSLDVAKELAMVQNNEIGRAIRRRLIQIDKDYNRLVKILIGVQATKMLTGMKTHRTLLDDHEAATNRYVDCQKHLWKNIADKRVEAAIAVEQAKRAKEDENQAEFMRKIRKSGVVYFS